MKKSHLWMAACAFTGCITVRGGEAPLDVRPDSFRVQVKINGQGPYTFALATNLDSTLVSWEVAENAKLWARQCILDVIGCAIAGASDELVALLLAEMREQGGVETEDEGIVDRVAQAIAVVDPCVLQRLHGAADVAERAVGG